MKKYCLCNDIYGYADLAGDIYFPDEFLITDHTDICPECGLTKWYYIYEENMMFDLRSMNTIW